MKTRKNYGLTAEQFVETWQAAGSVADFCTRTGMSKSAAHSRASYYRNVKKVGLKRMPKPGMDAVKLSAIVERTGA